MPHGPQNVGKTTQRCTRELPWRLIRHPPSAGDWNMAVDDMLLRRAGTGAEACLRLYAWDRPTLSLGYFQPISDMPPSDRRRLAAVRRPTGGGAILHDRELTYSVAVAADRIDGAVLYSRVNRALLTALAALGIEAAERGPRQVHKAQRGPFFCFARAAATDIIAPSRGGRKLAGGAQRRRNRAVLQHGSVLLETDDAHAVGVNQVLGRTVGFDELAAEVVRGFQHEFAAALRQADLSPDEAEQAEDIRRRRYGSPRWLARGDRKGAR